MSDAAYISILLSASFLAWLMALAPALVFLLRTWRARRDCLLEIMTDKVLGLYYTRFCPAKVTTNGTLCPGFRKDFHSKYGRRWYVLPILLLALFSGLGLWATAGTLEVWCGLSPQATFALPDVALGGFLGGMTWVMSDQFTRLRNRDFTPHDVYNAAFRLLIAIPLGYSLASFADPKLKVSVAFLLGAFPTTTLFTIARRLGGKQLGLADDAVTNSATSELELLESVSKAAAERFRDEGMASIVALAWTDPVDLTIRTNLEFDYVTDCISQALLWIYFRDQLKNLYVFSLRGALEAAGFMADLRSDERGEAAQATLKEMADLLKISPAALSGTLLQVEQDPSTQFLVALWANESGGCHEESDGTWSEDAW
jgi:hypothetical protein